MDVSIFTLVVLNMGLVLGLIVLILVVFNDTELLHDGLSLWLVLGLDLLDQLLGLNGRSEGSTIYGALAFRR